MPLTTKVKSAQVSKLQTPTFEDDNSGQYMQKAHPQLRRRSNQISLMTPAIDQNNLCCECSRMLSNISFDCTVRCDLFHDFELNPPFQFVHIDFCSNPPGPVEPSVRPSQNEFRKRAVQVRNGECGVRPNLISVIAKLRAPRPVK